MLTRIADDGHSAGDEKPSQVPIALLRDPAETILAARRMLSRHQPIQAARLRPDEKAVQSPTSATRAVATIGPMPGISSSRRLSSQDRCQAWMCFSMAPISAAMASY